MSRGKQAFFTVAALAATALLAVGPASAVTTSNSVAATDNIAPDPVTDLEAFQGADGVELTWELSPSDFVRQAPTGTDFTAGGAFSNVNDVAAYNVWRDEIGAGDFEFIGSAKAGETMFVDVTAAGASVAYRVTAFDGTNDSEPAEIVVNLGAAPVATITPVLESIDFGVVAPDADASQSFVVVNDGPDGSLLRVTVAVDGAGFSSPADVLTLESGSSTTFEVFFVAADVGNVNGDYTGTLTVRTNDPDNRERVTPLTAQITAGIGPPSIAVTPPNLAFSRLRLLGSTGTKELTLTNSGGLLLTGSLSLSGSPAFNITESRTVNRPPNTSRVIPVTFTPATAGSHEGTVTFTTNDPLRSTVTVSLTGAGVTELPTQGSIPARQRQVRITFPNTFLDPGNTAEVNQFVSDFTDKVARDFGINPNRIQNVRIIQGSIIVTFEVKGTTDPAEPKAADVVSNIVETLSDPEAAADLEIVTDYGTVDAVEDASVDVALFPEDPDGAIILGWFTRQGDRVGLDDFFVFADHFGLKDGVDADFNPLYDIFPAGEPDGDVGFDDFFLFADDFGKTVANADEIQAALLE